MSYDYPLPLRHSDFYFPRKEGKIMLDKWDRQRINDRVKELFKSHKCDDAILLEAVIKLMIDVGNELSSLGLVRELNYGKGE